MNHTTGAGDRHEARAGIVERFPYGVLADGTPVHGYRLRAGGLELDAICYGAIIAGLRVPDRDGRLDDVVLALGSLEEYVANRSYLGAVVGRCGNRIARGRFTLDGESYQLATNDGAHHLHGGMRGFARHVWSATPFEEGDSAGVRFARRSADGEEGYPGALDVSVTYTLGPGRLTLDYEATTDAPTIVNLAQHSYFDLSAGRSRDIAEHVLTISAEHITPVDAELIPTGELMPVAGTPFDFTRPVAIGARISDAHEQLRVARGYDHNYVLSGERQPDGLRLAARVEEPLSGRTLEVRTTEPGMQLYSGNFLDGSSRDRDGRLHGPRTGFCLETQHFPDSPNQASFPSVVLRPGQLYRSRTVLLFGPSTKKSLPALLRSGSE